MASTTSGLGPTFTFGGLASGLDTNSIISELTKVASQPLTELQNQQAKVQDALNTVNSFSSALSSLQSAAWGLEGAGDVTMTNASSSDTSSVTAQSGPAAQVGNYSISVSQLAQEQRTYSNAQSSATTALAQTGTLSLTVGGANTVNVNVTSDMTLTDISNAINASGARVSSSIVYDGTNYELSVRGLDSGAANAITFGESGVSLGLSNASNTYQQAQDAKFTIDGLSMTRSTNQVSQAIPGVTLALSKVTTSPVNVSVTADASQLTSKLQTFVSAYNAVVSAQHTDTGYGTVTAQNQILQSDSSINGAVDQLSQYFFNTVPGTTGAYNTLGSVGMDLQQDGTLSLDTTKLSAAVQADPNSVLKLFVTSTSLGATGVMKSISNTIDGLILGSTSIIGARISGFQTQISQMTSQENDMQTRIDQYTTALRQQYTQLEVTVSKYKAQLSSLGGSTSSSTSSSSSSGSSGSSSTG